MVTTMAVRGHDPVLVERVRELRVEEGYAPQCCDDVRAALAWLVALKPQVILCDVGMVDVRAGLRCSARSTSTTRFDALGVALVEEPFTLDVLLNTLAVALLRGCRPARVSRSGSVRRV